MAEAVGVRQADRQMEDEEAEVAEAVLEEDGNGGQLRERVYALESEMIKLNPTARFHRDSVGTSGSSALTNG